MSASNNKNKKGEAFLNSLKANIEFLRKFFYLIFDAFFDALDFVTKRLAAVAKNIMLTRLIAIVFSFAAAYYALDWAFCFIDVPPEGWKPVEIYTAVGAVLTPVTAIITGVLLKVFFFSPKSEDKE